MRINCSEKSCKPSFNALINVEKSAVIKALSKDKKLTQKDHSVVLDLIEDIKLLSSMKEDSFVEITPRVDSGQVNLITRVLDRTKRIYNVVNERSTRLLTKDENFRNRYVNSTKNLIKNVDQTRNEIDKLAQTILESKNIKGTVSKYGKLETSPEKIMETLEEYEFQSSFSRALNKGYNPFKRINSLLKRLDKKYTGKDLYIGTDNVKLSSGNDSQTSSRVTNFLVLIKDKNNEEQKRIPLRELFNPSMESRLF